MDLTSPAFPTPVATSAIYHFLEVISALHRGQQRSKTINQKSEHQTSEPHQTSEKASALKSQADLWDAQGGENSYTAHTWAAWFPNMFPKEAKPTHVKPSSHLQKELVHLYPGQRVVGPKWLCHCSQLWLHDTKSRSMAYVYWLENNGKKQNKKIDF